MFNHHYLQAAHDTALTYYQQNPKSLSFLATMATAGYITERVAALTAIDEALAFDADRYDIEDMEAAERILSKRYKTDGEGIQRDGWALSRVLDELIADRHEATLCPNCGKHYDEGRHDVGYGDDIRCIHDDIRGGWFEDDVPF
jgi:hypothetical protein